MKSYLTQNNRPVMPVSIYSLLEDVVDFDKVNTIEDIKTILKEVRIYTPHEGTDTYENLKEYLK
ncbi:hypothetical protein ABEY43_06165 [Priestia megaterium]